MGIDQLGDTTADLAGGRFFVFLSSFFCVFCPPKKQQPLALCKANLRNKNNHGGFPLDWTIAFTMRSLVVCVSASSSVAGCDRDRDCDCDCDCIFSSNVTVQSSQSVVYHAKARYLKQCKARQGRGRSWMGAVQIYLYKQIASRHVCTYRRNLKPV